MNNVQDQLGKLQHALDTMTQSKTDLIPPIVSAHAPAAPDGGGAPPSQTTSGNDLATEGSDLANPIFNIAPPGQTTAPPPSADPWTKITASFSASDQSSQFDQSSWGFSVGAQVSFGLFSAGGAYSHDESSRLALLSVLPSWHAY